MNGLNDFDVGVFLPQVACLLAASPAGGAPKLGERARPHA
jgi:hypothetical protein